MTTGNARTNSSDHPAKILLREEARRTGKIIVGSKGAVRAVFPLKSSGLQQKDYRDTKTIDKRQSFNGS